MLTFVRLAVFAMFVICVMMSLSVAALISVGIVAPNLVSQMNGSVDVLMFVPFFAVALAVVFGYLESVARRWPTPPA